MHSRHPAIAAIMPTITSPIHWNIPDHHQPHHCLSQPISSRTKNTYQLCTKIYIPSWILRETLLMKTSQLYVHGAMTSLASSWRSFQCAASGKLGPTKAWHDWWPAINTAHLHSLKRVTATGLGLDLCRLSGSKAMYNRVYKMALQACWIYVWLCRFITRMAEGLKNQIYSKLQFLSWHFILFISFIFYKQSGNKVPNKKPKKFQELVQETCMSIYTQICFFVLFW